MNDHQVKQAIIDALARFESGQLADNARDLFGALGYVSQKRLELKPNTAKAFADTWDKPKRMTKAALIDEWQSVDMIFQLTDDEIRHAGQGQLPFDSTVRVNDKIIQSYLLFAIGLRGDGYTRTELAGITREINKLFPMPVLVLFRHGQTLTLSIINRRLSKIDEAKDVLEKVTLIKDIRIANPHRAHLEILFDLSLPELMEQHNCTNFVQLHEAWQKTLDISELNKRFFREVANWYFWALTQVTFPKDAVADRDVRNALGVIRLITRLIFVWFIKEKGLVPDDLFDPLKVNELIKPNDPKQSTYYKAILQNLFFATLNQVMNTPGKITRKFRNKAGKAGSLDQNYMIHTLYRYEAYFKVPKAAVELFSTIPFLNGGLFECLDKYEGTKMTRVDGFSDRPDNDLVVPDELFFHPQEMKIDLNEVYGTAGKSYKVRGLIDIFESYKFTIDENTPIEEEIALDPELLGKVFENLLATYNPETGVTARKQLGGFYTPREIVNYMVDESLIANFLTRLKDEGGRMKSSSLSPHPSSLEDCLRHLLSYTEERHQFSDKEVDQLIAAIDTLRAIDPACGSGAFPMGLLHKLVFILGKLDPKNERWKDRQIAKAAEIDDTDVRDRTIADIEEAFECNELNYGRKLYLIENCIFGVDIQPVAVQIAKLRCFISLVVDQCVDDTQPNRGIRPLPNLETKFVAANTLLGIERPLQLGFRNPAIDEKEKELAEVRHRYMTARTPQTKQKYRDQDAKLRLELSRLLQNDGWPGGIAKQLAEWNPYDQNIHAEFFDSEWMFGIVDGFGISIGNPPYVRPHKLTGEYKEQLWNLYATFVKKSDLYCCFIEKSLNLMKDDGAFTFIVSDGFLRLDSFENLRRLLLNDTTIRKIIDFEGDVFESATVKTCILVFTKRKHASTQMIDVAQVLPDTDLDAIVFNQVLQDHYLGTYKAIFDLSSSKATDAIKAKMVEGAKSLGTLFDISFGLKTGDDSKFLAFSKTTNDHKRLLRGEDVHRYSYQHKGEYVWYVPEKMIAHKTTARPGSRERFEQPKVLIRDTGDGLIGTFDDKNYYVKDVLILNDSAKRTDVLKMLLAILNSSLMRFYYESSFPTLHVQRDELASLPLKLENVASQRGQRIVDLVEKILESKRADPGADTSALERKIDELVYRLYGLTAEEIKIVEGVNE